MTTPPPSAAARVAPNGDAPVSLAIVQDREARVVADQRTFERKVLKRFDELEAKLDQLLAARPKRRRAGK